MARRVFAREHNQLGVTFYRSGAIDLALEQFKRATKRAPRVASYWLNLGVALIDKDALAEAESALRRVLELNPGSQSAYFHLAQIYDKRHDETSGRHCYEQVIELAPDTDLARRAREHLKGWRPRLSR